MVLSLILYMEFWMSSILVSREERFQKIQSLLEKHEVIISLKANIPGPDKNIPVAYLLVKIFSHLIDPNQVMNREFFESEDGPYYLYSSSTSNPSQIKEIMILLEESSQIGRFVDIDVYSLNQSFHRMKPRKCFVCNDDAFVCARTKKHSLKELLDKMNQIVLSHISEELMKYIDLSMLDELNLHPKFGLVTPLSQGSHEDMNYDLMVKAKDTIIPYFNKIFNYAFQESKSLEIMNQEIRSIGLLAEEAMYLSTNGINAYKGLIYHLGYTVFALGKVLIHHQSFDEVFIWLKKLNDDYVKELEQSTLTAGKKLFLEKGIGGARKEMSLGLPNVKIALDNIEDIHQDSIYKTLVYLILHLEDTTFYKRVDSSEAELIINKFKALDYTNLKAIQDLTTECIKKNLSFGGSADLLVVSLFLFRVKKWLF